MVITLNTGLTVYSISLFRYSYVNRDPLKKGRRIWRCSVRSKALLCGGSVREVDGEFTRTKDHIHPGVMGQSLLTQTAVEIKQKAKDDVINFLIIYSCIPIYTK